MVRAKFTTGGAEPAKTGAFRCETEGRRAVCAANRRDRRRIGIGVTAAGGSSTAGRRNMAKIFRPDRDKLVARGFESVAHVPVIYDDRGRYCRVYNRYLRERATLDWHPGSGSDYPADRTIENIANSLLNFIQWSALRRVDFRTATYSDVLQYQREQISGAWSTKDKLAPSTANQRADEVSAFLTWASDRGLRGPFEVKRFFAARNPLVGYRPAMVRAGRAKENETTERTAAFVLPTQKAVKDWLQSVLTKRGYAKYLACRLILETGMRREEVELLHASRWPSKEAISEAFQLGQATVPMEIEKTKGSKPRTVRVPTEFANRVRDWIDGKRWNYALRHQKHARERTDILFLSDDGVAHGRPISAQTIYRCFAEVEPRPRGWSPHKGRHCFACFYLLEALATEAGPDGLAARGANWVMSHGEHWIDMLRRQFGHVSKNTTEIYLRWVVTSCITELASGWHRHLEDGMENVE